MGSRLPQLRLPVPEVETPDHVVAQLAAAARHSRPSPARRGRLAVIGSAAAALLLLLVGGAWASGAVDLPGLPEPDLRLPGRHAPQQDPTPAPSPAPPASPSSSASPEAGPGAGPSAGPGGSRGRRGRDDDATPRRGKGAPGHAKRPPGTGSPGEQGRGRQGRPPQAPGTQVPGPQGPGTQDPGTQGRGPATDNPGQQRRLDRPGNPERTGGTPRAVSRDGGPRVRKSSGRGR